MYATFALATRIILQIVSLDRIKLTRLNETRLLW